MRNTPIRKFAGPLLGVLGLLSTLHAGPAASREPDAKPVVVTYFFLPG
jgi:hypothetical protein